MTCEHCDDGSGACAFPYYGVAPHTHATCDTTVPVISTRLLPKSEWPANFTEDPDVPGLGTYTHCPECGDGARKEGANVMETRKVIVAKKERAEWDELARKEGA